MARRNSRLNRLTGVKTHKSYYPFSDEYPEKKDDDGFRCVKEKKTSKKTYIITFISVFLVTVIVSNICLAVSYKSAPKPVTKAESEFIGKENGYKAVRLMPEVFDIAVAEEKARDMITKGVNTVILPMKTAEGKIYFKPSITVNDEQLVSTKTDVGEIVEEFKSMGYYVFGEISCFADDIYARTHTDQSAYVTTEINENIQNPNENIDEDGENQDNTIKELWYDSSPQPHAWLSPFVNDCLYYLNSCISDVYNLGVDGICLENCILPDKDNDDGAIFPLNDNGDRTTVNEKMSSFVNQFASYYNDIVTVVGVDSAVELKYANEGKCSSLFKSGVSMIFLEIYPDKMGKNIQVGNNLYTDVNSVETQFVCDVYKTVGLAATKSGLVSTVVADMSYNREKCEQICKSLGEKSYIFVLE